jgi:hypothetical protein
LHAGLDKSWTLAGRSKTPQMQNQNQKALMSAGSSRAEGMGFEPATGFPVTRCEVTVHALGGKLVFARRAI